MNVERSEDEYDFNSHSISYRLAEVNIRVVQQQDLHLIIPLVSVIRLPETVDDQQIQMYHHLACLLGSGQHSLVIPPKWASPTPN
ncbi:unnamed protein product [Protopolystoma xenopodis]|uniref:Uncharacterized protein n=1 Tax=Protopolystoma xenopodis TaxID=117903 RepID=A0A3S5CR30_9PLAT|nr:unnamed protein product [Protopolystoma xenopodis]